MKNLTALMLFGVLPLSLISLGKTSSLSMEEICDNGIDDDENGLIDLNDPSCDCVIVGPVSLIPNPSFEEMDCCPWTFGQLDCATSWNQASVPTTDYINVCDWLGWSGGTFGPDIFPPPMPFPDGNGIVGFRDGTGLVGNDAEPKPNWKEYAGACLISPLLTDTTYHFEFDIGFVDKYISPPINVSLFGTTDCEFLPFGTESSTLVGCPTNGPNWVRLGEVFVRGRQDSWVHTAVDVVPDQDIYAIAIGPDCPHVIADVNLYYFFDNFLLDKSSDFESRIRSNSHPCQDDFRLEIENIEGFDYQWYKDGIALIVENEAALSQVYGEGLYQVRIDDGVSCSVSAGYDFRIPIIVKPHEASICLGDEYVFGSRSLSEGGLYFETFTSKLGCDSIVELTLKILGIDEDTIRAKVYEGQTFESDDHKFKREGEYQYTITSSKGCDSLILLQLEYFKVYIPNVFSPNEDGFNDVFSVVGESGLIQSVDLVIFDRWGNKVFEGFDWDGMRNGEAVLEGVYIYKAEIQLVGDSRKQLLTGSVTLLK